MSNHSNIFWEGQGCLLLAFLTGVCVCVGGEMVWAIPGDAQVLRDLYGMLKIKPRIAV